MKRIKPSFAQAAQNPGRYVFDLDREATEFYRQFPARKNKVFFVDVRKQSICGLDEKGLDAAAVKLSADDTFAYFLDDIRRGGGSSVQRLDTLGCLCVYIDKKAYKGMHSPFEARHVEINHAYAFDHEVGHVVVRNGMNVSNENLSECAADAYAALRHIQRFGTSVFWLESVARWRAMDMVFNRGDLGDHFTSPVISGIISDSARFDFAGLSPQETAERAWRYAKNFALPRDRLMDVDEAFAGFSMRGLSNVVKGNYAAVERLGAYVQKIKDPLSRKWGVFALEGLLNNGVVWNGKALALPAARFKDMRCKLKIAAKPRAL